MIHDVDFNPEIDRQAEDRAHRIGQTKPVDVYRLVAEGTVDRDILDLAARKRAVNERVMASGDPLDEVGAEAAPDAASVAAALSKALEEYRTANAEADDLEIGPQKSAEELLRERERLAEARGDVVDVGADDADAAMPPVSVKPEGPTPAVAAAVAKKATTAANRHAAIEMGERVRIRVKRILGPPAHGTVVGHVVGFEGDTYDIEHGEGFHLIISNVKRGDRVSRTREEITLWDPRG